MPSQRTKQLAFRLSHDLIDRIEACEKHICDSGLDVSRTDVVRLLLTYALNSSECNLHVLIGGGEPTKGATRPGARPDGRRRKDAKDTKMNGDSEGA